MIQKLQNIKAVSMDTSQWAQVSTTNTDNFNNSSSSTTRPPQHSQLLVVERKARPLKELPALSCPRCSSTNTKFCYYNNYSLTQPRYLCKACKRYWTHGGSLRNIPVGGGSRKNKKHPSGSNPSITNDLHPNPSANPIITSPPPIMSPSSLARPSQVQDLNMSLAGSTNSNYNNFSGALSAMELLRSTTASAMYGGGFGLHDFSSASSIDNGMRENGGRLLFPFGDLNELSVKSSNESGQQNYMGFWSANANLGGTGGSW